MGTSARGADNHMAKPSPLTSPAGDRAADNVVPGNAIQAQPVVPLREERSMLAAKPEALPNTNYIGRIGSMRIGTPRADDHIGESVAIDIPGRSRPAAAEVGGGYATEKAQDQADRCRVQFCTSKGWIRMSS